MRTSLLLAVAVIVVAMPSVAPLRVRAQPVTSRVFRGIEVGPGPGPRRVKISFSVPIRYLRHAPRSRGDSINVQFAPLELTADDAPAFFRREYLQIPRDFPVPIEEILYEGVVAGRPLLDVRLKRSMSFEVQQGRDLRSIEIILRPDAAVAPPDATVAPPGGAGTPAAVDDRTTQMMEEGRRAMTAGEFDRAVLIFTKVLSGPETSSSPEAQEFLALARERKGQLAHAKAEYEAYLERYPDGEGADRVRQRLATLVTARIEPPSPPAPDSRRDAPPEVRKLELESFGSIYVGYRRESLYLRDQPEILADSSLFTDLHIESRLHTDRYTLRSQYTGGYRHEFLDGGSDESRTNSLFIEAEDHPHGLSASIGRRSLSTAGILGRFDGVRMNYEFAKRFELGVTAGFPVDSSDSNRIETNQYFAGVNFDVAEIAETVDAQVYAIAQWEGAETDRAAVGAEIRYFEPGRFVAAFVDYDVYFRALNLAQLIGNWQLGPSTVANAFVDYRLVPTLTAQNALQGQVADEIADLLATLSQDELKDLARDRTARATTINLGINQDLNTRLQLAVDFSALDYSGTEASAGVDAIDGTGFEFSYSTQLIWSDFLKPRGIGIAGLRFFDGSQTDIFTATLDGRYPLTRDLRVNPRLRADYRIEKSASDVFSLIPSLRLDYHVWKLNFDSELGVQWRLPTGPVLDDERWGYSISVGVRYDY